MWRKRDSSPFRRDRAPRVQRTVSRSPRTGGDRSRPGRGTAGNESARSAGKTSLPPYPPAPPSRRSQKQPWGGVPGRGPGVRRGMPRPRVLSEWTCPVCALFEVPSTYEARGGRATLQLTGERRIFLHDVCPTEQVRPAFPGTDFLLLTIPHERDPELLHHSPY
jgi:hypothetical protein